MIRYNPGDKAKIVARGSRLYNKGYYKVIKQYPTGDVLLETPLGRMIYGQAQLKKWVEPPPEADGGKTGSKRPLTGSQDIEKKDLEHDALYEFFSRRNSDKTENKCPLCGGNGTPLISGFICRGNSGCKNRKK